MKIIGKKLKGFLLPDLIIGMTVESITSVAVFSFLGLSVIILATQISSFSIRGQTYSLTRYFVEDIAAAKYVRLHDGGKRLEIFTNDGSYEEPDIIYEYKDSHLYVTLMQSAEPMESIKVEELVFDEEEGIVRLIATPSSRADFKIDVRAYIRAETD